MPREIKFRGWFPNTKKMEYDPWGDEYSCEGTPINDLFARPYKDSTLMQFTGLKDKNGKEIYEKDFIRVKCGIGSDEDQEKFGRYHDGYYLVGMDPLSGIELSFTRLAVDDPKNQFPVHTMLSSYYRTLGSDSRNCKYDQIVVLETWGTNSIARDHWKQNHWSNDLEIVGNLYENHELLKV